jgi:hypothetical protein
MKKLTLCFAGIVAAATMLAGVYLSGCGSSKTSVTCCQQNNLDYCNCYEGKTCTSSEKQVSSCPHWTNCCRDVDMSDFCTCWDLTCSETAGQSSQVSSCP